MKFFFHTPNLDEIPKAAALRLAEVWPTQAICAAKAGASFISPCLGRLDDIGDNGLRLLEEIVEIYNNYEWKTEVLAASLRHPIHVIEAARLGRYCDDAV